MIKGPPSRAREWYAHLRRALQRTGRADALREAALAGRLGRWTQGLTDAAVEACREMGWVAVARGHLGEVLPVPKQEYLAIDVMAFPVPSGRETEGAGRWRSPVAAFELENREAVDAVSYSLWKVSVVRCQLGGVFCYRRRPEEIGGLIAELTRGVMADVAESQDGGCELLLVVGTRSKAEGFPDGFFKPYEWEPAARRFRALW